MHAFYVEIPDHKNGSCHSGGDKPASWGILSGGISKQYHPAYMEFPPKNAHRNPDCC